MNTGLTLHDGAPEVSLREIVDMLNAQPISILHNVVSVKPDIPAVQWCDELITHIQHYNVHHRDDPFPMPTFKSIAQKDGGYETILSFSAGLGTVYRLKHLGVNMKGTVEKPDKETMEMLKTSFSIIPTEDITLDHHTISIAFENVTEALVLDDLIKQQNSISPGTLPNSHMIEENNSARVTLECVREDLTQLAGLGLKFPGHELHARLYKAQEANRGADRTL